MPPFSSLIVSRPLQSQAFPCAAFYNIFFSLLAWKSPFHSSGLSLNVTFSESFPNYSIKRKITPLHSLSYILGFFFFSTYYTFILLYESPLDCKLNSRTKYALPIIPTTEPFTYWVSLNKDMNE